MRRPPHGSTTHPTLSRPGNGFGRPAIRRPGPLYPVMPSSFDPEWLVDPMMAPVEALVGPEVRPEISFSEERP